MNEQVIPAEAVEAAEEAVFAALLSRGLEGRIDGYEQIARAALEAAAPFMRAEWERDRDLEDKADEARREWLYEKEGGE